MDLKIYATSHSRPFLLFCMCLFICGLTACVQVSTDETGSTSSDEQVLDTGFVEVFANTQVPDTSALDTLEIEIPSDDPTSGTVAYTIEIDIMSELTEGLKGEQKALAAFLPNKIEQSSVLSFKGTVGRVSQSEEPSDGKQVQMQTSGMEMIVDLNNHLSIALTTIGAEEFAVKSEMDATPVAPGTETKEILGYTCKKAAVKFEDNEGTAWYTEDIPFGHSPFGDVGTPGLVLELESPKITAKATSVELTAVDSDLFKTPTDAKYISQQQLEDITQEMLDKLGGNVMVKTIK